MFQIGGEHIFSLALPGCSHSGCFKIVSIMDFNSDSSMVKKLFNETSKYAS